MIEWRDATSYRQGDAECNPTSYRLVHENLRISITCSHIDYPGKWIVNCREAGLEQRTLNAKTVEEAKSKAVSVVRKKLAELLRAANELPL